MALRAGGGAPRATRRYARRPTEEEEDDDGSGEASGAATESGTDPVQTPPPPPPSAAPAARPAPTSAAPPPARRPAPPPRGSSKPATAAAARPVSPQIVALAGSGALALAAAALLHVALRRRRRTGARPPTTAKAAAATATTSDASASTKPPAAATTTTTTTTTTITLPKATPDASPVAPGAYPGDDLLRGPKGLALARVVRERVAADNSCLFHAVGFCMHRAPGRAPFLRRVVAREVASDPQGRYTEAFLGMPNADYCDWILQPQHWGGGIELAVLAAHYRREIAAWNVRTGACHVFGEEQGYQRRCMVVYDGSHYDALAVRVPAAAADGKKNGGGSELATEFNPRTRRGKLIAEAAARLVDAERRRLGLPPAAVQALRKVRGDEKAAAAAGKKKKKKQGLAAADEAGTRANGVGGSAAPAAEG